MKNILLFIVLGLFIVGCHNEEFPLGPEYGQKWRCVDEDGDYEYDSFDHCAQYCETTCIRFE